MVDGCKWNNFPCKLSRKKKHAYEITQEKLP